MSYCAWRLLNRSTDLLGKRAQFVVIGRLRAPEPHGPVALPARDEMDVVVKDHLAGRGAVVLDDVETVGLERGTNRDRHALDGVRDRDQRLRREREQVGLLGLADDQRMAARGRVDIHERQCLLILVDLPRGDLTAHDTREDRWHAAPPRTTQSLTCRLRALSMFEKRLRSVR